MKFLICTDSDGGEAWLTNESCVSRYGMPVLEVTADDLDGTFGPADVLVKDGKPFLVADVVAGWGSADGRTPDEIAFASDFLSQYPDGPQIVSSRAAFNEVMTRKPSI